MSNSKFDQTITGGNPTQSRSNHQRLISQSIQQEKSPRGQRSFKGKGHFYPKTKFQEEVNYRKKYLNECSHRNSNNFCQVLHHALIS